MTFINFKILIYIFVLLTSCSSHISNEFSDNSTSTQIKSNEFKLKKNKISKKKLENSFKAVGEQEFSSTKIKIMVLKLINVTILKYLV